MEKDIEITKVVFRKFKESNNIIAFFPEEVYNKDKYLIWSYMFDGEHAGGDYYRIWDNTTLATEEEYREIKLQLENSFGYNFKVLKRCKIDWNKINKNYGKK